MIFTIPENNEKIVLEIFNSYQDNCQFPLDKEHDNRLLFSDLQILRGDNGKLLIKSYIKPTNSGRSMVFQIRIH